MYCTVFLATSVRSAGLTACDTKVASALGTYCIRPPRIVGGAIGKVRRQVTQEWLGLSALHKGLLQVAISPNVTKNPLNIPQPLCCTYMYTSFHHPVHGLGSDNV